METKTYYEHLSIEHNGIPVHFVVDYINSTVSIIEGNQRKPKEYKFANRGISYEQGWYNILEAMKKAMEVGFDRLKEREEEKVNDLIHMSEQMEKADSVVK